MLSSRYRIWLGLIDSFGEIRVFTKKLWSQLSFRWIFRRSVENKCRTNVLANIKHDGKYIRYHRMQSKCRFATKFSSKPRLRRACRRVQWQMDDIFIRIHQGSPQQSRTHAIRRKSVSYNQRIF